MKAITSFWISNRKKYFVAMALSLFLIAAKCVAGGAPVRDCDALLTFNTAAHPTGEWVLDKTVSNVDFYHSIMVCNGKNVVFLKFVNRNAHAVKIGWQEIFITNNRERKEGFTGRKEMLIRPGTTTPTDCAEVTNKKTIIRGGEVDPMSVIEILNFEYKDIVVAM